MKKTTEEHKNEVRKEIIQITKNFFKGQKLIKEAEELQRGVDSITFEVSNNEPVMVKMLYEGWVYRVKIEDLID